MTFPANGSSPPPPFESRPKLHPWQLRLVLALPAILILFMLAYGLVSYKLFTLRWDELENRGAGEAAAFLLSGHLLTMLGLSILALLVGLALALTILRPIRALSAAAQLFASGKLDQPPAPPAASAELGDLWRSFNSMIAFVQDNIQERNRFLMEGIVTGLMTLNLEGRITALNSTGSRILGVGAGSLVGQTLGEARQVVPERGRGLLMYLEDWLRQDRAMMRDDPTTRTLEGGALLVDALSILRDASGHPIGLLVNFHDFEEIRAVSDQLSKTDRLAALGTFTMGLAHEIRNPLGAIKGMLQLLDLQAEGSPRSREIAGRAVREVNRLDLFIRELLDFSSQSALPPALVEMGDILYAARNLATDGLSPEAQRQAEIVAQVRGAPKIWAERERLVRAFGNIIRNALEAVNPGGRVTLAAARVRQGGEEWVEARVHNTGSTIPPELRGRVFDPFFSTKETGTGLGLSIAFQIIAQNQGDLSVEVDDGGVTFLARFAPADPAAPPSLAPPLPFLRRAVAPVGDRRS